MLITKKVISFKNFRAFSLLELMLCVGIMGILLMLAAPLLTNFVEKNRTAQLARQFLHAINLAKTTAITRNTMVTFCKSDDGLQCQGDWNQGGIVFTDHNANAEVDDNDQIIFRLNMEVNAGSVRWRAFQNKQFLQLTAFGDTNSQSGNFTFCPTGNDLHFAQQIIINRSGRVRLAVDTDGDGIRERSDGSPLGC